MTTGMLIDLGLAPYSGKGTGESAIFRKLSGSLRRGDTLVADSYYCTYWMIAMCRKLGVHVVMKNHHKRDDDPIGAKRFSGTERTTQWTRPDRPAWMPKKEYRKVPKSIEIRLSDIAVDEPSSRCKGYTVATTMLDREIYPGEWLGSMYQGRWMVEPDISSIKCTMGLEHLRGQSPEALEREIWTAMLTYNLVRANVCAIVGNRPGRAEPREQSPSVGFEADDSGAADRSRDAGGSLKNPVNRRGQCHSCPTPLIRPRELSAIRVGRP